MIEWVFPIDQYVPGQNFRVSDACAHVTGKGLNVARALCALDHPARAIFPGAGPLQQWGVDFNVPLLLEAKIGNNWLDTKALP